MKLILQPDIGTDPFFFGDQRVNVRKLFSEVPYVKPSVLDHDIYKNKGIILGYDQNDQLEFIEVSDENMVEYQGIQFFSLELSGILERLKNLGYSAPYDSIDSGYNFTSIGLGLYCEEGVIKGVSIYAPGYYEE